MLARITAWLLVAAQLMIITHALWHHGCLHAAAPGHPQHDHHHQHLQRHHHDHPQDGDHDGERDGQRDGQRDQQHDPEHHDPCPLCQILRSPALHRPRLALIHFNVPVGLVNPHAQPAPAPAAAHRIETIRGPPRPRAA